MNNQPEAILADAEQQKHVRILAGMASGAREPRRSRVMYALLHLEAGDARLQTVRGVVVVFVGCVCLLLCFFCLLCCFVVLVFGLFVLFGGVCLCLFFFL